MRFGSKAFSLVTFTAVDTFGARAFPEICHSLPKFLTLLRWQTHRRGRRGGRERERKVFKITTSLLGGKILTSR